MSTKDQRIGYIGLGKMGSAMAARLIDAGFDVTVWSRTQSKADELVARGATRVSSPEEVIATGTVFSMLTNEEAVREVFTRERLRAAPNGFVHVGHATISPAAAAEFDSLAAECGSRYLSAPVVGRPEAVAAGQMIVLASGDPDTRAAVAPMLDAIGKRVWDFGPAADAAPTVKIAVNYLILHALQALSESITLLEQAGIDTGAFVDAINDSIFPGAIYSGYGRAIATRTYAPAGFTTTLGHKDLMLALHAAENLDVELPSGPVLRDVFETAIEQVGKDLDWSCVAEITRRRSAATAQPAT
ncbi:MAG: NAD(P)-dependent oxidoreductase [Amycolatopsis sp.]|jgi:3-hydroxyisobutyrate dehydrogenase-like beta-hydroxyacid dehydrogenase|uniref:NAD(P)-dependent oxidoreductase n=1 Tax=Amycolatopsis sp. TaxID=37632 RepID=UPI0026123ABB|nr:NAD(P)-dependent oxidoreductase [Amycolatopsis sp.]MCU1686565.1 NAD(P)-dependent oxidoreductase [Amycolatopsis sp.]